MYTSPDDARSDLLLSGAVFVFGPVVIGLLLATLPLNRILLLAVLIALATPVVLTALVPFLLVRYRGESWQAFGFGGPMVPGLMSGATVGLPIVAAGMLGAVAHGAAPTAALPLLGAGPAWLLDTSVRLLTWVGLGILASYVTVKGRDAFRPDYRTLPDVMVEIGRVLGLVLLAAALLRLALTAHLASVLLPLGVAGTAALVYRQAKGPSSASRATLLTPTVLLAVGSFFISFSAARLLEGIWTGALVAVVGLAMGAMREQRGSAWAVIGLALVIALLTPLPAPLRLGL